MHLKRRRPDVLASLRDSSAFRSTFASFLRHRGDDWRGRRVDHFTPIALKAASRRITLHGQINKELLADFAELEQRLLPEEALKRLHAGVSLPLYVPFAAFAKEPWLQFSTIDGRGSAVPVLTRFEGSAITGRHLVRVLESAAEALSLSTLHDAGGRDRPVSGAILVASALASINPTALNRRIERRKPAWQRDPSTFVSEWVAEEARSLRPDLGGALADLAAGVSVDGGFPLAELRLSDHDLPEPRTLTGLIVLGVRDILKLIVDQTPFKDRATLFEPNDPTFGEVFASLVVPGLNYLNTLVVDIHAKATKTDKYADHVSHDTDTKEVPPERVSDGAMAELAFTTSFWTAYMSVDIGVSEPFVLKSSEVIAMPNRRRPLVATSPSRERDKPPFRRGFRRRRVTHRYQLTLRDAVATHVEITSDDPELDIVATAVSRVTPAGYVPMKIDDVFGTDYQDSHDLRHFYTSKRPTEASAISQERLLLGVNYRVSPSVLRGYRFLVGGLLLAAAWLCHEWVHPAWANRTAPTREEDLVLVSVTMLVLPLWFTGMQHKKPLVHEKLRLYRMLMYTAFSVMIASPVLAYSWRYAGWFRDLCRAVWAVLT
jgi:hypothetical protein